MFRRDYSWSENALGFGATLTLSVLAVTSLGLRYVTMPISCWTPAQFTDAMTSHAHHRCFQQTKIFVGHSSSVPEESPFENPAQFTYHQWVPFALGVAAILCLLPHVIWRMLSGLLWLDAHALVRTIADNQLHNAAGRHVMLRDTALLLQGGFRGGNSVLTVAALGRKVLVFVVCLIQVILIVAIFNPHLTWEDSRWGRAGSTAQRDFNSSLPLPENFFCDLRIRTLQNEHAYTLMCNFPLAQVYNKGLAFLFYFFLLLALCCLLDTLTWTCRLLMPALRDVTIKRYLTTSDPQQSASLQPRFLDSLGWDGRLLLAVTADHCGPVAAADLTNHLWLCYMGQPRPGLGPAPGSTGPAPVSLGPAPVSLQGPAPATAPDPAAIPLLDMSRPGGKGQ